MKLHNVRTSQYALRNLFSSSFTRKHSITLNSLPRYNFLKVFPITHVRMTSTLPRLPVFEALSKHDLSRPAVIHNPSGRSFTYGELVHDVADSTKKLKDRVNGKALSGERIAFLVENGYDYVVTLLSIFANDAIAVPLCTTHPNHELRYIIDQSESLMLLASAKFQEKAEDIVKEEIQNKPMIAVDKILEGIKSAERIELEDVTTRKGGLMLYTSGTTSRPKGVLLPQSALTAQCQSLLHAWEYSPSDRLLHVLPLHHIHGVVNALLTPLFAGSSVEFLFPFHAKSVWDRFSQPFLPPTNLPKSLTMPITFFTVVPTIYTRLLSSYENLSPETQAAARKATSPSSLRLNISGSAALPTPVKKAWEQLTGGNVLLERFGMTEVGMALSCGLKIESRVDGSVGWPLPGVEARLVDLDSGQIIPENKAYELNSEESEKSGEIQLRGETVFQEYWRNPEATERDFVKAEDGGKPWFRTGDVAVRRNVQVAEGGQDWTKGPMWFILGRKSADIIKTGGEKVSALEVEREMLSLPEVLEVAVVALPSDTWGQKVACVVVLSESGKTAGKGGKQWSPLDMRKALRDKLANYKIPQEMKVVDSIPRNAMGKINKKELVKMVFQTE